jgi:hypothetical protein
MIRIAITSEAFNTIATTLPIGTVGLEPKTAARGICWIWVEQAAAQFVWRPETTPAKSTQAGRG